MTRKASKKKVTKKTTPSKEKGMTMNKQLFCHFYVQNRELRGNATRCYSEAFGYQIEDLPKDDAVWENDEKGQATKIVTRSSYDRAANICAVEGNRLLRYPKIQDRITELYNSLLKDEVVDSKLAEHIMQNDDPGVSVSAIREYNKLRGRIIDKKHLTDAAGKPVKVVAFTIHAPETGNTD